MYVKPPHRLTSCVKAVVLVGLFVLSGCSYPYAVRNVGQGKTAVNLSVGGQLIDNLDVVVPVPAVVASAQHGLTEAWDVHGSLHFLAAAYKTLGYDIGATRRLFRQQGWRPELTASVRLGMLTNFADAFRIYPELEAFASYLLKRRWLTYLGMSTFYDFFWDGTRIHWGPALGGEFRFARHWAAGLALRWISPHQDTSRLVAGYASPGSRGMVLLQLALRVNLEGWGGES